MSIAAISKAQIIHFNEHKFFVPIHISAHSDACTPPAGTKFPISAETSTFWTRLGSPLVSGSENYFSYASFAIQWDDSIAEVVSHGASGSSSISFVCDDQGTKLYQCDGYDDKIDPYLYTSQAANRSVSVIHAAANLKGVEPYCSIILQSIIANDADITLNPIMTFRE